MPAQLVSKSAPMASAPLKYLPDGAVDWGRMWDSFCVLAQDGGPAHRGTMLYVQAEVDVQSESYRFALNEIIRGVYAVSGLTATAAAPGWIAVQCPSASMAGWLCEAIEQENVQVQCDETLLLIPVGQNYTLKGEIKNVITVVAKTTHYWQEHLPIEVKYTLALQEQLKRLKVWIKHWLSNQPHRQGQPFHEMEA